MKKHILLAMMVLFGTLLSAQIDISGLYPGMPVSSVRDSLLAWGCTADEDVADLYHGDIYGCPMDMSLYSDDQGQLNRWTYTIFTGDDVDWEDWFVNAVCEFHNDPCEDVNLFEGYVIYLSSEIKLEMHYSEYYDLVLDYIKN